MFSLKISLSRAVSSPLVPHSRSLFARKQKYMHPVPKPYLEFRPTKFDGSPRKINVKLDPKKHQLDDCTKWKRTKTPYDLDESVPTFKRVLRQFTLMVHPDHFTHYPEVRDANQKALQSLQTFVADLKSETRQTGSITAKEERVIFYIRASAIGAQGTLNKIDPEVRDQYESFVAVPVHLHYATARSKHEVYGIFSRLFASLKLPSTFRWTDEYFQSTFKDRVPENK